MDFGTGRRVLGQLSTRQQINYIMQMTAENEEGEEEGDNFNNRKSNDQWNNEEDDNKQVENYN